MSANKQPLKAPLVSKGTDLTKTYSLNMQVATQTHTYKTLSREMTRENSKLELSCTKGPLSPYELAQPNMVFPSVYFMQITWY